MRSDTNRAVQPQNMVRGLKVRTLGAEGLYYPFSENKGAVTAKLICIFVFAYAKNRFSHNETYIIAWFAFLKCVFVCSCRFDCMCMIVD